MQHNLYEFYQIFNIYMYIYFNITLKTRNV